MKNKKTFIYAGALAIVIGLGIFLITNYGKKNVNSDNNEFAQYIAAHTSGVISKGSPIKIKLTNGVVSAIKNSDELPKNLIKIRPKVEGECTLDGNMLEFTPKENLPSGENFYVEFNLMKLKKVKDELKSFNFEFKTIKQSFDLSIEEQKTIDRKALKYQQVIGVVQTADIENNEKIAEVFKAKQGNKKLAIKWKTGVGGLSHFFTIDSVERLDKKSEISLEWDGDIINVEKTGSENIEIPSVTDFEFISAKVIQSPEQYLQLQFSDPLDETQELSGLISVAGTSFLKYVIDDNTVKVYTENRIKNTRKVTIRRGIKNILGYKIKDSENFSIAFEAIKPAVKIIGKGSILPSSDKGLILPFEAVNLKAVDVTIIKIYEDNILQFLQVNDIYGESQLRRVGKPILRKKVKLDQFDVTDFSTWHKFSLDLSKLIEAEPGAIYRVELSFRQKYSTYECELSNDNAEENKEEDNWNEEQEVSSWDNYGEGDYYYYDYWEDRNNPCKKAYYSNKKVSRNIIASDLGIIAKKSNNNKIDIFVTDMKTTKPSENVNVIIYNYQEQILAEEKTNKNGKISFSNLKNPYFAVAKYKNQSGYLKLVDGNSLSLSRFDISGASVKNGLKGYIYGERGVWRPGDSLFLTFVLKEENKELPNNHPIIFTFKNPQGQLVQKVTQTKNNLGVYTFKTKTEPDDITGNYGLTVSVGTAKFRKTIKVETIKPNRLKIKLNFGKEKLVEKEAINGKMNVKWLHGAIGKDLKVTVDATLKPVKTKFKKYTGYSFDDPTKHFSSKSERVFSGKTDTKGDCNVSVLLSSEDKAPGMLKATFVTKVFEKGGNFSIDQFSLPYSPYKGYVGVKLPKGDKMRGMLLTDKKHKVQLITLDENGNKITENHIVKVKFYKLSWRWWWDEASNSVSSYNFRNSAKLLSEKTITTSNGEANWDIEVKYPDWGRYFVFAKDINTGHTSGKIVYIDWPGWAGRAQKGDSQGASMLMFSADKTKYEIGETARIKIPTGSDGRALISVETGTEVIKSFWVETQKGETEVKLELTKEMTPNIYVHVSLLQKHAQTANDRPIRMYGVIPIMVENKETHITPIISMPDELEAEKAVTIKVSEKNNKSMTYTIAVVDEGLLDLTHFRTPDAWKVFYAKEALGVKTWDIYDDVIGAYAGKLDRLLAIGGDMDADGKKGKKANRFKPVVKFLGPFTLKNGTKSHTFKMPKYIGSVRTMVIASDNETGAYGSAEKTTRVIKPIMVLGTLPRMLSFKEKVKLPVSIFAMKKSIKNVTVSVKTNEFVSVVGESSKKLHFTEIGEEDTSFDLKVNSKTGIATVQIIAKSGSFTSSFDIELDVRNPNHETTDVLAKVLQAGETWETDYYPVGIEGTNKGMLEVSSIPPIDLEKRLKYLIKYPHGCIEQTTSAVFPQLFVSNLIEISPKRKAEIEKNIKAGLKKLENFQLSNGGFSYWQNGTDANEWGTNYAMHFMLEADKKGYAISRDMLKKWMKFQKKRAKNWNNNGKSSQLIQAYRLYTLALAGHPQKSAMNRLKEQKNLSNSAKWRLASAYYLAGKKKVASSLISGLTTEITPYKELSKTFGSDIRDKAMILETLTLTGNKTKGFAVLKDISESLSGKKYLSTQTSAYALLAVSKYIQENKGKGTKYLFSLNGSSMKKISTKKVVSEQEIIINSTEPGKLSVKNTSGGMLYARIILSGIPDIGTADNKSNDLIMFISYKTPDGKTLSPLNIPQGTDFVAEVTIKHPGVSKAYKQMALSQIFPSGWEIINPRMIVLSSSNSSTSTYQDIRDDRVFTYFDLDRNQTKTYRIMLNASYAGEYWLPPVYCEAMYDGTINARKGGTFVKVSGM